MAEPNPVETSKDYGDDKSAPVRRWLAEIKAYDTTFQDWTKRVKDIKDRYRDERGGYDPTRQAGGMKFNILWANIQTMQALIPGNQLTPDVTRRYKDRDPAALCAAMILQRCLSHSIDSSMTTYSCKMSRDDYLLGARGQLWVRYVPVFGEKTAAKNFLTLDNDEESGEAIYKTDGGAVVSDEDVKFDDERLPYIDGEPYRPVVHEEAVLDHVSYKNFGHTPAPTWDKVRAVWKWELMTRDQLVDRFGEEIGNKVNLTKTAAGVDEDTAKGYGDIFKRAQVYEIWDKTTAKARWVSPGYMEGFLDEKDDPLGLLGFFPCPRPAYGTMTSDSLIPVPDYAEYQDQAKEIDNVTQRIHLLIEAMKVAGAYDASFSKLENILKGEDNILIPVDDWAMFAERGGIKGAISFVPLADVAAALQALSQVRRELKHDLYEISGMSDIVRGQGEGGRKTATEQRIKGQFANLRLEDRKTEIIRFIRDALRIMAEIISEHFSESTLLMMSGWQWTIMARLMNERAARGNGPDSRELFADAVKILRDDRTRSFRIDIESEVSAFEDAQGEKTARVELLQALSQFLGQAVPAGEKYPPLAPALAEAMLFGIRSFKRGRQLEMAFEYAIEDMQTKRPEPSEAEKMQQQVEQQKAQAEQQKAQLDQQKAAQEMEQAKLQAQIDERQARIDIAKMDRQAEYDARAHEFTMEELEAKHANTMREMAAKAVAAEEQTEGRAQ